MSDTFDIEKLREEVNPVFSTAQSCVQILAFVGDADAKRLLTELGLEDMAKTAQNSAMPREVLEVVGKSLPAFNSRIEMRFLTSNSVLRAMGAKQVVDLPCGYTPRAIKLAGSGIRYFGFDLPAS